VALADGTTVDRDSLTCKLTYKGRAFKPVGECTWFIARRYDWASKCASGKMTGAASEEARRH
jgi:hypothetical protein